MRVHLVLLLAFLVSSALAQPALRVEYGKTPELHAVERVFIYAGESPEIVPEVQRFLHEALPALIFTETEEESDLTVSVQRKALEPVAGATAGGFVTAARAAHTVTGRTIRLYLDVQSKEPDLTAAIAEVLKPLVSMLKEANPRRFGSQTTAEINEQKRKVATVHSTAGLRPGLSRKDVQAALGRPTRIEGGPYMTTWTYATTDGTMRIVFGGDRLISVALVEKK